LLDQPKRLVQAFEIIRRELARPENKPG